MRHASKKTCCSFAKRSILLSLHYYCHMIACCLFMVSFKISKAWHTKLAHILRPLPIKGRATLGTQSNRSKAHLSSELT